MSQADVWIVFTKCEPLEGCDVDFDGCDYYFAEAYVPVASKGDLIHLDAVISRAQAALAESQFELNEVSKCLRYMPEEWQADTPPNMEVNKYAREAAESGNVQFGGFRSEEIEELTQRRHVMTELDAYI